MMRRFMTFLMGAFFGALVGAVTALMLAPTSGDEFRARVQERSEGLYDEIRAAYETRMAQLEGELSHLRGRGLQGED
jgi:gas vesicle protein